MRYTLINQKALYERITYSIVSMVKNPDVPSWPLANDAERRGFNWEDEINAAGGSAGWIRLDATVLRGKNMFKAALNRTHHYVA